MTHTPPSPRYVECPRDAWQGLPHLIPTDLKRQHITNLLAAGVRSLDLGSFVSPKAVPQMADTEALLAELTRPDDADFLCIVANIRGLERALAVPQVSSVGYPLSVNETFQRRNTGKSLPESWQLLKELVAEKAHLTLVVYVSMGFGNPYSDPWQAEDTAEMVARLRDIGIREIALADTMGNATPTHITEVIGNIAAPEALGLHLHATYAGWPDKFNAALACGIRWFEGALSGIGGCPFAGDALVGNVPTESALPWLCDHAPEWRAAFANTLHALPALKTEADYLASLLE